MPKVVIFLLIIVGILMVWFLVWVFMKNFKKDKLNKEFEQICKKFEELGMNVKVYQTSSETVITWLIKVFRDKAQVAEEEFSLLRIEDTNTHLSKRNSIAKELLALIKEGV